MDTVEIDGLTIAFERTGTGPPLVLLHGFVGDGRSVWRHQVDALGDLFTVVVWDAPGAGGSSDPPEDLGMAGYADLLADFLAALGLGRAHVAGLSFGGALALELARRHPDLPSSLVLVSAYAGWGGSLPPEEAKERLRLSLALSRLSPAELASALLPTMFTADTPSQTVDAFGASVRATHPSGFRAMARAAAEDLSDALPHVGVPTLVVGGDRDVRAPLEVAQQLEAGIAGARRIVLPGTGHLCNLEAPQAFNEVVREFLLAQTR